MRRLRSMLNKKEKKLGVYLSYTKYRQLMEDLHDLKIVAERRNEKPISLRTLKNRLRKKGAL
ncbi:MAG: hypothetical protein ACKVQC_06500 [Elusimicrobiota bacterium]